MRYLDYSLRMLLLGGKNAFCWFCWLKITFRCLSKIQDSFRFFKLLVALFKIDPFFHAIFSVGKIIFKMPLIILQFANASAENDVQLVYSFQKNGRKISCYIANLIRFGFWHKKSSVWRAFVRRSKSLEIQSTKPVFTKTSRRAKTCMRNCLRKGELTFEIFNSDKLYFIDRQRGHVQLIMSLSMFSLLL